MSGRTECIVLPVTDQFLAEGKGSKEFPRVDEIFRKSCSGWSDVGVMLRGVVQLYMTFSRWRRGPSMPHSSRYNRSVYIFNIS